MKIRTQIVLLLALSMLLLALSVLLAACAERLAPAPDLPTA